MTISPVIVAVGLQLASGETYCPTLEDFDIAWGDVSAEGNGWRVAGEGGVHGKTSFNLLGGSIEFDMDVCGGQTGVNNNLYLISPEGGPASGYCDIQENDSPICMELDIIENNGKCLGRTTWHVNGDKSGGCDQDGCYAEFHIDDCIFHMRSEFAEDGTPTAYRNGEVLAVDNGPSDAETAKLKELMESLGAAIASTQWTGWVPDDGSCGGSGLRASQDGLTFAVTNLVVEAPNGVLFGPEPPTCDGTPGGGAGGGGGDGGEGGGGGEDPAPSPPAPAPAGGGGGEDPASSPPALGGEGGGEGSTSECDCSWAPDGCGSLATSDNPWSLPCFAQCCGSQSADLVA